jgi:hypothetical protein
LWKEPARTGRSRLHYFFLEESSDFFELSFELSLELSDFEELSDFAESSDFDLESFLEAESPFEEDDAEPVEDFLA